MQNIINILIGVISTFICSGLGFWWLFRETIDKLNQRLNKLEKQLTETINKYEHGYNPEHLCESCYKGRYTFIEPVGQSGEKWVCDDCGKEPAMSWILKRKRHS